MTRPLRIEFTDAYYHVMNRGRGYQDIYQNEDDFELFIQTMKEACVRFGIEIHAYCLMRNHYHLLIKTPMANLGRAMRHINGVYTQRYNRLRKTDGPLFRGRYKAIVVDSDEYLLHLSKYIHLNPLKANLVETLEDYPWSSYLMYIGKKLVDNFIITNEVYGQLSGCADKPQCYYDFMNNTCMNNDIKRFYGAQDSPVVLAKKKFLSKITPGHSVEVSKKQLQPFTISLNEITLGVAKFYTVNLSDIITKRHGRQTLNEPRKVAMYIAHQYTYFTVNEVAKFFGLSHYGGITAVKYHVAEKVKNNPSYRRQIEALLNFLNLK